MPAPRQTRRFTIAALAAAAAALVAGYGAAPSLTHAEPETRERLHVFAAASLKDALEPAAAGWSAATGADVVLSFAGSATLAKQIEHGAPADLFISASTGWMAYLAERDRIDAATIQVLASNALVLVAPADAEASVAAKPLVLSHDFDIADQLGDGRLAIALTSAVPAGQYGRAALESLGLWEAAAPRLAETQNVRAALALVARGEAPLGMVYASDAAAEPRVRVVATVPAETHPAIRYPAALVTGQAHAEAAAILDWLASDAAWTHFQRQRFLAPPRAPRIADIAG